jgi:hypothetical protein
MMHTGMCEGVVEQITLPMALHFVTHSQHQRNFRIKAVNFNGIWMLCGVQWIINTHIDGDQFELGVKSVTALITLSVGYEYQF